MRRLTLLLAILVGIQDDVHGAAIADQFDFGAYVK